MRSVGRSPLSTLVPTSFLLALISAAAFSAPDGWKQQGNNPAALGKIRSMAEAQHEIVILLIQKKEFDKAATEAGKIFNMNWPDNEEPVLLTELKLLSRMIQEGGQPATAVRLLDSNSKSFKANASLAWIWKEKGYLYKMMGQGDKAMECFRTAQRLEEGKPK